MSASQPGILTFSESQKCVTKQTVRSALFLIFSSITR